jgi:hypothetical protein
MQCSIIFVAELTTDEQEKLLRLPKIDILQLSISEQKAALLGLSELVFCWCYEQISTMGILLALSFMHP